MVSIMRILEHGDPSKYNPTVAFRCGNCGCLFLANRTECGEEADHDQYDDVAELEKLSDEEIAEFAKVKEDIKKYDAYSTLS